MVRRLDGVSAQRLESLGSLRSFLHGHSTDLFFEVIDGIARAIHTTGTVFMNWEIENMKSCDGVWCMNEIDCTAALVAVDRNVFPQKATGRDMVTVIGGDGGGVVKSWILAGATRVGTFGIEGLRSIAPTCTPTPMASNYTCRACSRVLSRWSPSHLQVNTLSPP
ncbi:hypothetical protein BU26DRAFT_329395 [Trematosphaeria pertusa]|uniref:Uncharacterized protein n=1 Tax=Trematosphaeria pertusa TaxID=390896 RepID=A0A6A6IDD2_9PLEO|nr:uncharacterized protein BU26DRAFT_329395 [Trematosphaeria pertusa]KAF2248217.1 hypothetical protein BU26DRAFT_329395 [Trematosphaeria pertusa]